MIDFDPRDEVRSVLKAFSAQDLRSLEARTRDWTATHVEMLACWALETHSQRFQQFDVTDSQGMPDGVSGAVLHMLSLLGNASPPMVGKAIFLALSGE